MRVLVTAATRHGSTFEVAEAIAEEMREAGAEVEVRAPDDVDSLEGFDAVVIGSPAYMGHWLDDAKKLVERQAVALKQLPCWLFTCGPIGEPPKPDEDPVDVKAMMEATGAREHRLFGGKLERSKLGFMEKAVVGALRVKDSDNRDWDAIREWASRIVKELQAASSTA